MNKNLGNWDRALRTVGAVIMGVCAVWGPLSPALGMMLGATSLYLLLTAGSGACVGYRLMGKSSCPAGQRV